MQPPASQKQDVRGTSSTGRRPGLFSAYFALLSVFVILLTVAGVFSASLLREEFQRRNHEQNARLLSEQVGNIVGEKLKVLAVLAENPLFADLLEQRIPPADMRLQSALNVVNEVSRSEIVYVLDREGLVVACANHQVEPPLPVGTDYSFRPFFHRAMEDGETEVYPAMGMVSQRRGIHLSTPIRGRDRGCGR